MSNVTTVNPATALAATTIEKLLLGGDLQHLQPAERLSYYNNVCESLQMNPLTRPFDYLVLNNKLVLYPNKGGGEQLRQVRKVSLNIVAREKIGDVYVVTARATMPDGRSDEATGAVDVGRLAGEKLANAYMKAETKAKRRVTLSICGLNMVDESEIDSIDGARRVSHEEAATMPVAAFRDATPATNQALETQQGPAKTKWPFKYPENLPQFVEDFAGDELIAAEKQLTKWKEGFLAGRVKAAFPDHGDFFIELLRDLMRAPRGSVFKESSGFVADDFDSDLDRALAKDNS